MSETDKTNPTAARTNGFEYRFNKDNPRPVITKTRPLAADSPGSSLALTCLRFGAPGARPKAYLQAGLHADEMPGVLTLQHLIPLLETAEAEGRIAGEVLVVPLANPIGFAQWVQGKPQGRQDLGTMQNFNRGFPDLAALAGDDLEERLGDDPAQNVQAIRAAFGRALAAAPAPDQGAALRLALMGWSHDADHVLDIHCDHHAVLHLYASPARPGDTAALCRAMGAELALIEEISGGHAFDEAHSASWVLLRRCFGDRFPIPAACFATTLELRGQMDVDDATAARDAAGLMDYLTAVGVLAGQAILSHPDARHLPLSGALEVFAPQGGVVTWAARPGDTVTEGQVLGHVTDPMMRLRLPVTAPCAGLLFRIELWPSCLRGQGLAHVAGAEPRRSGDLLSA
ncbi:succinylglutamate desuccinylase/aspartoacylase family protein [Tabrizicola fusiformis]|uniref:succinylglutamate desuccinylase/aspartoacylase family protein n=1 Tax=Tabrizicola sp. SY72 TaxID=2741673 RepID=UPI0015735986|nr:succinylglutamate desuccinylase/aspartoacylase family protein [Tabrizicola sp. SY72]NTT86180.1 succinylglutamate desuccinylase/aspartoacylase family protein [Tabrizicola sp. SY72]